MGTYYKFTSAWALDGRPVYKGGEDGDMWAWFCKSSGRWYVGPEWFLGIPGGFLRAEDRVWYVDPLPLQVDNHPGTQWVIGFARHVGQMCSSIAASSTSSAVTPDASDRLKMVNGVECSDYGD